MSIQKFISFYNQRTSQTFKYYAHGGFWIGAGKLITGCLSILLAIGFANILEKQDYGTYKYILALVTALLITTLPGMQTAVARAVARGCEGSLWSSVLFSIRFGLIGTTISLLISLYYYLNENTLFALSFLIVAPFIPLFGSLLLYTGYLNGKKMHSRLAVYSVINQLFMVTALLLSLFLTQNVLFLISAYVIGNVSIQAILFYVVTNKYPPNSVTEIGTNAYGLHLSVIKGISILTGTIQNIFLVQVSGVVALASYTIAIAPIEQIRGLNRVLPTLVIPKISTNDWVLPRRSYLLKKMILPLLLISCISALYILVAPYIFDLLFPRYVDSVIYSQVFAMSLLPTFCINIFSSILKAKKETKKLYMINIISDILLLISSLSLTFMFGLWGLILSIIIHKVIMMILYFYFLYSNRNFTGIDNLLLNQQS